MTARDHADCTAPLSETQLAMLSHAYPNLASIIHGEPPRNADETRVRAREELAEILGDHAAARTDVARLREALRLAHCCATLREDGTCIGCHVSEALAATEPKP